MMRKIFLLPVLMVCLIQAQAQNDSIPPAQAGIGYFSEGGFYPGLVLQYEKTLLSNRSFQFLVAAKTGFYVHFRNHTGVFLMVQSGQRFRLKRNFFFEHFLGVGYLHSFLNGGDAYYVDAAGQVHRAHHAGNPHFMPSVTVGLSYDFSRWKRPTKLFARPMIFWQIPFNQSSLVLYGVEIGALVTLKP